MTKKIKVLSILFDTQLRSYEIPAFRGAMVEKVGRREVLFHNHLPDGLRYSYPLIQYKVIGGKPAIICIEEGVDQIHKYFEKKDWSIIIGDRTLDMKIASLNMNYYTLQAWDSWFDYRISNWLALNQENWKKYNETDSLTQRIEFLESILKGNILSFAKGIEWTVDNTIEVMISSLGEAVSIRLKSYKVIAFNANFSTNVFLPNFIGLGKGTSKGFGVVKYVKTNKNN